MEQQDMCHPLWRSKQPSKLAPWHRWGSRHQYLQKNHCRDKKNHWRDSGPVLCRLATEFQQFEFEDRNARDADQRLITWCWMQRKMPHTWSSNLGLQNFSNFGLPSYINKFAVAPQTLSLWYEAWSVEHSPTRLEVIICFLRMTKSSTVGRVRPLDG